MDPEKARRAELMAMLEKRFMCFQEVTLRHAMLSRYCIRADVVAIPLDQKYFPYAIAFEVKLPNADQWNFATWSKAMHQASDYVYATIEPQHGSPALAQFVGRRIAGAFIFPSPDCYPRGGRRGAEFVREGDEQMIAGALQLTLHFRVGHAGWQPTGIGPRLVMSFGPNEVWRSDVGFCGTDLLAGKRRIGSQKIDVFAELDGIGRAAALEID